MDLDTEPRPTWFERLRAIPRGVGGLGLMLLALVTPFLVRAWFLSHVPDIGDPFDVAAFCQSMAVSPEQDALTLYRNAGSLYGGEYYERFSGELKAGGAWSLTSQVIEPTLTQGWGVAGDNVKGWVAAHEASLLEWKQATEMDRVGFDPSQNLLHNYRDRALVLASYLGSVASLRGRQCEAEHDFAGAFQWYRARLRSRLRVPGWHALSLREQELNDLVRWATLPEVTSAQLRTALSQLRCDRASFRPASDFLKAEYVRAMNSFNDRDGLATTIQYRSGGQQYPMDQRRAALWRSAYWVVGEPERTRRIYRQLVANQLREIDKPEPQRRPTYLVATLMYLDNPAVPLPPGHLPVGRLDAAIKSSAISNHLDTTAKPGAGLLQRWDHDWFLRESRGYWTLLELLLALQAHHRDHGAFPSKLEDLVPNYIDAVPVDPCDAAALNVRYRLDISDHATVWSVGANGTDENGFQNIITGDTVLVVRAPAVVSPPSSSSPEPSKD